jgi:integrase
MAARKHGQAAAGEVTQGQAASYEHGEDAAAEVAADLSDGIKEMVAVGLQPGTVWGLEYSKASFPTINNVGILAAEAQFWSLGDERMRHILEDVSAPTPVERGDGHMPAVRAKEKTGRLNSTAVLAAIFDESVGPCSLAQGTREGYWAHWKSVITWAVAHDEVAAILPMSQTTLKALTQELMMIGCATGTIRNIWSAIEDRHRRYGYTLPLGMQGDFTRMSKAVAAVRGQPSRLIFPVGSHHVRDLLELAGLSDTQTRDVLICVLGTTACMRVGEVSQLQFCDLLWGHDSAWHTQYNNTLAVRIYKRKQDQARKGLYPRVGAAVAARLRSYTERLELEVSEDCSKKRSPGARCRSCPPVFPHATAGARAAKPVSRQQVTKAVTNSLAMLGVDTTHYSGLSMRRGGISAALVARVPEPILFLQSGHGSDNSARNYMVPRDPHILYETYLAFGL